MRYRLPIRLPLSLTLPAAVLMSSWSLAPQLVRADAPAPAEKAAVTPPSVGTIAPDFELNELKGATIKLSKLAEKGPIVLIQLRGYPGYQCPLCTVQVGQFIKKADEFAKAKTSVVLIYPGPAAGLKEHADEFIRGKDFPANFYLLMDPDYKAVNLYGLRWDAPHETAYPSTFVLNSKREVLFAKVSKTHGDRSKVDEVLAALPK